jgi:hypothetical protein
MKNNLKKRMEDIAGKRFARERKSEDPGSVLQQQESEKQTIERFNQLRRDVIMPFVSELNEIFRDSGDQFLVFSDETSTATDDKSRTFCQVFYFPKGRPREKAGLNTASILFECMPVEKEIRISSNIHLRPSALKEIDVVKTPEYNEELIERHLSGFVSDVTKNLIV